MAIAPPQRLPGRARAGRRCRRNRRCRSSGSAAAGRAHGTPADTAWARARPVRRAPGSARACPARGRSHPRPGPPAAGARAGDPCRRPRSSAGCPSRAMNPLVEGQFVGIGPVELRPPAGHQAVMPGLWSIAHGTLPATPPSTTERSIPQRQGTTDLPLAYAAEHALTHREPRAPYAL